MTTDVAGRARRERGPSALKALRRPGLTRLGVAGLLSETGDWMLMIALPVYVLQLTGSAFTTAAVFVLELVPAVLAAPFVGVLVDRVERWRLMGVVAAVQAVLLLPLLWVDSPDRLWLVVLVVIGQSLLGSIIEPTRNSVAADIAPPGELLAVNTALGLLAGLARLVGGPLGGLLLGLWGIQGVVLVDAVSFALAAVLFGLGRRGLPDRVVPPAGTRPRVREEWLAGLTIVARHPALRRIVAVSLAMGVAQGGFLVLFVLFVLRDLDGGEATVGLLRGVQAIGALAGGLVLGWLASRLEPTRLLPASLLAFGLLSAAVWNAPLLTTALPLFVALFVLVGAPGIASLTSMLTLLQQHAPPEARGRVLSVVPAVYAGAQAGGMLLAGVFATGVALTVALQVQAACYLLAAVLALRIPRAAAE